MKIAIVGSAPATCDLAPWDDLSWDMWTLAWRDAPRVSAAFEMHDRTKWCYHGGEGYESKLAKTPELTMLFMPKAQPDIPRSVTYPFQEVLDDLAPKGSECDFYTSSLAYMLALAIYFRPEEIGLFGADMTAEEEYGYQRPAMTYLVGLARGRGIKVTVPPNSPLLKAHFTYGKYTASDHAFPQAQGLTPDMLAVRIARYEGNRANADGRLNKGTSLLHQIDGAIGEAKAIVAMPELTREAIEADIEALQAHRADVAEQVNLNIAEMHTIDGALGEAKALREAANHFNRGGVIAP